MNKIRGGKGVVLWKYRNSYPVEYPLRFLNTDLKFILEFGSLKVFIVRF